MPLKDQPSINPGPFAENIAWAKARGIDLPEVYYGQKQGIARAKAFSVAGVASLDQLQFVKDTLDRTLADGGTLEEWKRAVTSGELAIDLPAHRLENIFRTNLQGEYAAGRCAQIAENLDDRPFLMYDATNDGRTRPAHAAMDGFVARYDDPVWKTWTPPCGYQCRCTIRALTEAKAQKFLQADAKRLSADPELQQARAQAIVAGPDAGWDYSVCEEPMRGVERAVKRAQGDCDGARMAARGRRESLACLQRIQGLLGGIADQLREWDNPQRLAQQALGEETYQRLARDVGGIARQMGLSEPQGVALAAYTDRALDAWPLMNRLAREMGQERLSPYTDDELLKAGVLIMLMDQALERLPSVSGEFQRGVRVSGLVGRKEEFLRAHTKAGRIVQWNGYTSIMAGPAYPGDIQMIVSTDNARDIGRFSLAGEPELLLPRSARLQVEEAVEVDGAWLIVLSASQDERPIRREYQFNV